VFGELIARIRREEALRKTFEWYGEAIVIGEHERASIDRELLGGAGRRRRAR
jgi:hypothetical protein